MFSSAHLIQFLLNFSFFTDKHALINPEAASPRERAPLKENGVVQQEMICGYDGLRFIIVSSVVFALAVTVGLVISIISGQRQVRMREMWNLLLAYNYKGTCQ